MGKTTHCTLCNMCMIEDATTGRVLVQHRLPKATNPWHGLTFPGGHVEAGESITASTVREIREETGLTVSNLRLCGVVEWETIGKRVEGSPAEVADDSKYIVFMYRTNAFTGTLKSSAEGKMEWMTLDEMRKGGLAPFMAQYLRVLLEDGVPQAYGISGSNRLACLDGNGTEAQKYQKYSPKWFFQHLGVEVGSFQSKLTPPQEELMAWYWQQDSRFQDDLLKLMSSGSETSRNLSFPGDKTADALPLLKKCGLIEFTVIDHNFLQRNPQYESPLFPYLRKVLSEHPDEKWAIIKKKAPGGYFCELAARWQVQKAVEQFKQAHPTIACHVWHDLKLSRQDGSPLTDFDIMVRIGTHFYCIEVKAASEVAESFHSGQQGKAHELLLAKAPSCTRRLSCIGIENDDIQSFSQDYMKLSTLDKEFYDIIEKDTPCSL